MAWMSELEKAAKEQLLNILREGGYATYAYLLSFFDVKLTDDPDIVAYMKPDQAVIVLNKNLDISQVSVIVRHEIMHEYLTHLQREQKFEKENPGLGSDPDVFNTAADYEISNLAYTDADKTTSRSIKLNGDTLSGLVTEDEYPDWVNYSFEDMYKELLKRKDKQNKKAAKTLKDLNLSKEVLDKIQKIIDKLPHTTSNSSNGSGNPSSGGDNKPNSNKPNSSGGGKGDDKDDKNKESGVGQDDVQKKLEDAQKELDAAQKELNGNSNNQKTNSNSSNSNDTHNGASGNIDSNKENKLRHTDGHVENKEDVFPTKQEQEKHNEDVKNRIVKIKQILSDISKAAAIKSENVTQIYKEKEHNNIIKAEREAKKFSKAGIVKFRVSLTKFIRDTFGSVDNPTWSKLNINAYQNGLLKQGISHNDDRAIPSINIYLDVSGSFSDPAKTAASFEAVGMLNRYVKKGMLKMRLYYVSDEVSENNVTTGAGADGDAIIRHVRDTKPNNVIVITDGDANYGRDSFTVPGTIWFLFYDETCPSLETRLRGKQHTYSFLIDYK